MLVAVAARRKRPPHHRSPGSGGRVATTSTTVTCCPPSPGRREKRRAGTTLAFPARHVDRACRPPANGVGHCETDADRARVPEPRTCVRGTAQEPFRGSGSTRWGWHLRRNAATGRSSTDWSSSPAPGALQPPGHPGTRSSRPPSGSRIARGARPPPGRAPPRLRFRTPTQTRTRCPCLREASPSCSPSKSRSCGRGSSCRCEP